MSTIDFIRTFLKPTARVCIYSAEDGETIYEGDIKDLDRMLVFDTYIKGLLGLNEDGELYILTSSKEITENRKGDFVDEVFKLFELRQVL